MYIPRVQRFDLPDTTERFPVRDPKSFGPVKKHYDDEFMFNEFVVGGQFFSKERKEANTPRIGQNADGMKYFQKADGSAYDGKYKFVIINDPVNPHVQRGSDERLVLYPPVIEDGYEIKHTNLAEENESAVKTGVRYAGMVELEGGRIADADDIELETGHYRLPNPGRDEFSDDIREPADYEPDTPMYFMNYLLQKFDDFIDGQPYEVGDTSTVGYGELPQAQRIAQDFAHE